MSGEGGSLLINSSDLVARAEIIRHKGTDRARFLRGEVDKYTWIDIGSSYVPSEITAAFLWAQMEAADTIGKRRLEVWHWYDTAFAELERREILRRPVVPVHCGHNAHMFYVIVPDLGDADPAARGPERRRHQRRVPLCAAARIDGRAEVRASSRVHASHRKHQPAADSTASLDRDAAVRRGPRGQHGGAVPEVILGA